MFRQRKKPLDFDDDDGDLRTPVSALKRVKASSVVQVVSIVLLMMGAFYVVAHLSRRDTDLDEDDPIPRQAPVVGSIPESIPSSGTFWTRRCTAAEAAKQGKYFPVARVRGCPSEDDAWLRFTQSLLPHAKVFVDIGSNKGYTAARFFELWTPEFGLDARTLHGAIKKVSQDRDLTECGACNDCMDSGVAIVSIIQRMCSRNAETTSDPNQAHTLNKAITGLCESKAKNFSPIRVYSFDGNPVMVEGVTRARDLIADNDSGTSKLAGVQDVPEHRLPRSPKQRFLKNAWSIELAAFSDSYEPGKTIEFTLGIGEKGHIVTDGGATPDTQAASAQRAVVPVLTVDQLRKREGLDHIDILKIDTEGHDPNVLMGAVNTFREGRVTLVLFEYNKVWSKEDKLETYVTGLLEESKYACYLEGKNLLLKLNHGCWHPALELRAWSNVWCVSSRSPQGIALASVFDSYSVAFL